MRGFKLDSTGDVVIENNDISCVNGTELMRQTIQTVLGTNKGEWFGNPDEGITFTYVLGKNVDENLVRAEIQDGLKQVDEEMTIDDFSMDIVNRVAKITFTAHSADEAVDVAIAYG